MVVNIACAEEVNDPGALVRAALESGGPIFIGVVASASEVRRAQRRIDDAAAEVASVILGDRQHRSKPPRRNGRRMPRDARAHRFP